MVVIHWLLWNTVRHTKWSQGGIFYVATATMASQKTFQIIACKLTRTSLQRLRWNLTRTDKQFLPRWKICISPCFQCNQLASWRQSQPSSSRSQSHDCVVFTRRRHYCSLLNSQLWKNVQWLININESEICTGRSRAFVCHYSFHSWIWTRQTCFLCNPTSHSFRVLLFLFCHAVTYSDISDGNQEWVQLMWFTATRSRRLATRDNTTKACEEPAEAQAAADSERLALVR